MNHLISSLIIGYLLTFFSECAENYINADEVQMEYLSGETTVGEIVARKSSLSRVFENYQIDYCCSGKITLNEACQKKNLDPQKVIDALTQRLSAKSEEKSWLNESLTALIDHIQEVHHAYLWAELPKLKMVVEKVATVHGEKHPELAEVRDLYIQLQRELEEHLKKEEDIIFPLIKKLESDHDKPELLHECLAGLEHEHDQAGEILHRLRVLTHDFTPPQRACNTYKAMLGRLQELELDIHQHVHKENSILFPRVAAHH